MNRSVVAFVVLLMLYIVLFSLQCHFTLSYGIFPFLLMFPVTEMLELRSIQSKEMRSSLTDLHTHFHYRYVALGRVIAGTYTILACWIVYLLHTLETCSVELACFTALIMAALGATYGFYYRRFHAAPRRINVL